MNILMMNHGIEVGSHKAHVVDLSSYLLDRGQRVRVWAKGGPLETRLPKCVHRRIPFDHPAAEMHQTGRYSRFREVS